MVEVLSFANARKIEQFEPVVALDESKKTPDGKAVGTNVSHSLMHKWLKAREKIGSQAKKHRVTGVRTVVKTMKRNTTSVNLTRFSKRFDKQCRSLRRQGRKLTPDHALAVAKIITQRISDKTAGVRWPIHPLWGA